MIHKPGKDPTDISSYRPINLLPTISKVLEKLIYKQITNDTSQQGWIPHHHFGFRRAHSTIQQSHCLTHTINKTMEDHRYCTAAFLDISRLLIQYGTLDCCSQLNTSCPQATANLWNYIYKTEPLRSNLIQKPQPYTKYTLASPREASSDRYYTHCTHLIYQHRKNQL